MTYTTASFSKDNIHCVGYTRNYREGEAIIRVKEGIDVLTYLEEYEKSLMDNGYKFIARFQDEKDSRLFGFHFMMGVEDND